MGEDHRRDLKIRIVIIKEIKEIREEIKGGIIERKRSIEIIKLKVIILQRKMLYQHFHWRRLRRRFY